MPEFSGYQAILNVQGDSPFVSRAALADSVALLERFDLGTAAVPLAPAELDDPSAVKVIIGPNGEGVTFSRLPVPGARNWRHLGVYAYRRAALTRIAEAGPTKAELDQGLEQLRAMELGLSIGVALLAQAVGPSVDTEADLREAQAHWTLLHEVAR
jgi:3-deoxy-manno-octulosonate cytidylyltransferase (CMP-KDO synthetase)